MAAQTPEPLINRALLGKGRGGGMCMGDQITMEKPCYL